MDSQKQLKTDNLKAWLETHLEQRLFKDEQNELIELCGLKDNRNRLQKSIGILSEYLKEHYKVQLTSKRVTENKEKKTVWIITKMD